MNSQRQFRKFKLYTDVMFPCLVHLNDQNIQHREISRVGKVQVNSFIKEEYVMSMKETTQCLYTSLIFSVY